MSEGNSLEKEIMEIARQEADKNRDVTVDNFPDVQRVNVENWPEQKEPIINVQPPEVKVIVPDIKVPTPVVNIEATEVNVEPPDLSILAKGLEKLSEMFSIFAEKETPEFDYERFEAIAKANKTTVTGHGGVSSKRYLLNKSGKAVNPSTEEKQDIIIDNQTNGNQLSQVQMADSASIDAFARLRVSNPETIFDSKQIHSNQPLFWDDQQVSGAGTTSVWSQNTASSVMGVALNTAGNRVRQTFRRMNYQPGKSQLIKVTGTLGVSGGGAGIKRAMGYFDDNNGVFMQDNEGVVTANIRSKYTGVVVDNAVAQENWNLDKMDGTGASGVTLNSTTSQILIIDLAWLGVGRVRIGFKISGIITYVHEFNHANVKGGVYMSTPNLPLRYEIENDGAGAASELEHICGTVISEGGTQDIGINHSVDNNNTPVVAATGGTIYALCGMRLNASHLDGVAKVLDKSVLETNTVDYQWMVLFNPVLAGTAPTFSAHSNSFMDTAVGTAVNTVTFDALTHVLGTGYVKGGKESGATSDTLDSSLLLGSAIDGTQDEIWLCVKPLTANADFLGSILWREIS